MEAKVAVVTGGSQGIGEAIATKFAQNNTQTVILDLDEEKGNSVSKELSQMSPSIFIKTDVSKFEELEQARNKVIDKFGKIDYVIINAGISYRRTIKEISVEEWQKVTSINLNGSFYTAKAFYDDLVESKGKVVIISSGSGITGTGGGAHYAASKAGQHGLMRSLSKELGPKGVNVNCVAPRVIQSDLLDYLYPDEQSRSDLITKIPISRFGTAEDIANISYFLTQEESSYIHGQIILADGGRTL